MLDAFFASLFSTEYVDELPNCKNIFRGNDEEKVKNYQISPIMVKAKVRYLS